MKPLTVNYFYGTIAAAAVAATLTGVLVGLIPTVWNLTGPYPHVDLALTAPLAYGFFGFLLGVVPAFILLAAPLAWVRDRPIGWRIGAGMISGLVFDAFGFLHLEILFPPLIGFGAAAALLDDLHQDAMRGGLELAAPILAGAVAGYGFHLCQGSPSPSRDPLLPPVA